LDGTLLRNDTSLSQYSKDTLNALLDQGLLFTVANAIPALKEQATGIIDTNEEDGVARYISTCWYETPK